MSTINHRTLPTILTELRSATVPTGVIEMYGGATAPGGWLLCDGSAVSRITYASLFAVLGTTYGVGDGSTTFNLPTFANKFARGNTPGTGAGADTHTHTAPDHSHGPGSLHAEISVVAGTGVVINRVNTTAYTDNFTFAGAVTTTSVSRSSGTNVNGATATDGTSTTDSVSNVPAYTGVQYIIKI